MSDGSFDENSHHFLTHILPWILLPLGVFAVIVLIYHCRRGGECNPRSMGTRDEENTLIAGVD